MKLQKPPWAGTCTLTQHSSTTTTAPSPTARSVTTQGIFPDGRRAVPRCDVLSHWANQTLSPEVNDDSHSSSVTQVIVLPSALVRGERGCRLGERPDRADDRLEVSVSQALVEVGKAGPPHRVRRRRRRPARREGGRWPAERWWPGCRPPEGASAVEAFGSRRQSRRTPRRPRPCPPGCQPGDRRKHPHPGRERCHGRLPGRCRSHGRPPRGPSCTAREPPPPAAPWKARLRAAIVDRLTFHCTIILPGTDSPLAHTKAQADQPAS